MTSDSFNIRPDTDVARLAQSVMDACDTAAEFSDTQGQINRQFLSPSTQRLHDWLAGHMRRAGMDVRTDALGNVIGHYAAADEADPNAGPVLLLGSHTDTVVNAGRYDGVLGVMLAIGVVESLMGARLPFAIDVLALSEEEGVRFRVPYLGSSAVAGCFERRWLELADSHGVTLAAALATFGQQVGAISAAAYNPVRVMGFLEAHIEQGPVLTQNDWPVAVVTAIAGQTRMRFRFNGLAGHAGTVPMDARTDALAAAAEFIVTVESLAKSTPGLRATVGAIEVHPNVRNVIPGETIVSVDVRHPDDAERRHAVEALLHAAHVAGRSRGVSSHCEAADEQPAAVCDAGLIEQMVAAAEAGGYRYGRIFSGAGHDAVIMSRLCPSAMLFIRHPGLSHHPEESVAVDDVAVALDVLRRTVLNYASARQKSPEPIAVVT